MTLTRKQLTRLLSIVQERLETSPPDFGWINSPEVGEGKIIHDGQEVSAQKCCEIFGQKINGAYTERNLLAILATVSLALAGVVNLVLVQGAEDDTVAYDPEGWLCIAVSTPGRDLPDRMFHIPPGELDISQLGDMVIVGRHPEVSGYNPAGKTVDFVQLVKAAQLIGS